MTDQTRGNTAHAQSNFSPNILQTMSHSRSALGHDKSTENARSAWTWKRTWVSEIPEEDDYCLRSETVVK